MLRHPTWWLIVPRRFGSPEMKQRTFIPMNGYHWRIHALTCDVANKTHLRHNKSTGVLPRLAAKSSMSGCCCNTRCRTLPCNMCGCRWRWRSVLSLPTTNIMDWYVGTRKLLRIQVVRLSISLGLRLVPTSSSSTCTNTSNNRAANRRIGPWWSPMRCIHVQVL